MVREKCPSLLFLSPQMRKRARKEFKKMTKKHQKLAWGMKILSEEMLKEAKRDNHSKR